MLVCISVSLMSHSVTVCVSLHVCLLVYMHSSAHTSLCIHTSVKKRDKESECLSVCAGVCKRQKMVCVCVCGCVCRARERDCGLQSGWVESLGADRLYAWTSISSSPPCSTVQLGGWAHYRPTLARDCTRTHRHRHARTHTPTELFLTFFLSIPLSHSCFLFFTLHFFLSHCHILSSFFLPLLRTFFSFPLLSFFSSFSCVTLSHSVLSHPAHSTFLFLFLCHPFFYFSCSFLFLTYSTPSNPNPSFHPSLSLAPQPSSFSLTKSRGTRGGEREGRRSEGKLYGGSPAGKKDRWQRKREEICYLKQITRNVRGKAGDREWTDDIHWVPCVNGPC